jgi:hypothetical protein
LNVNALLGPLGNYGGATRTIPLLPGSPALGASSTFMDPGGNTISADQRGNSRPSSNPDIGAFQSSGFTLTPILGSGQTTTIGTPFANPLLVDVTANNPAEPVAGGIITFTGPSSSTAAGVTPFSATETISSGAQASLPVTADSIAGTYVVSATASPTASTSFNLTNDRATPTVKVTAPNEPFTGIPYAAMSAVVGGLAGAAVTDGQVTFAFYSATDPADPLAAPPSAVGSYQVVANFSGDNNFIPASSAPVSFQIVQVVPMFTSVGAATFTASIAGSFTVTTNGSPTAALTESGSLPSGVTFVDNGNGTAAISGTPASTAGGTYAVTITAVNGTAPNGQQSFTLTVDQAPAITSASSTAFAVGTAGLFTIASSGYPAPSFTESGPLPPGVTFTDNGNGTASISGTPANGAEDIYNLYIRAANGISPETSQSFALTVQSASSANQAPLIISADNVTFTTGVQGSLAISTTGAPAPALTETGALPAGIKFVDKGNGVGKLRGTPAAGTGGTYVLVLKAKNGVKPNGKEPFTLTVNQPPAITSASSTTFATGVTGKFTVTTTGFPTAAIKEIGTLPQGVTFTDKGNGNAKLKGAPATGTAGSYPITLRAKNGVTPRADQSFTLRVINPVASPSVVPAGASPGADAIGGPAVESIILSDIANDTLLGGTGTNSIIPVPRDIE